MAERAEIVGQAAADWLARRDAGRWAPEDQAALDRWLDEAVEHKVAWLRLNAAWDAADGLRAAPPRRAWPRMAAGLAVAAALVAGVFVAVQAAPEAYATTIGGSRAEMLADGSRLELNTDSRVVVRQTDEVRTARIDRGEAYFTVAGDMARPFVVEAGDYSVSSQGGAFSVHRTDDRVLVAVERGKVLVRRRDLGTAEPVVCNAGQMLEARPEAARLVAEPSRLDRLLSWRRGLIAFDDTRLSDVAAEFNRYNRTKLVITDPALAEARVGGAFRPTNLDAFIRILAADLGVSARREDGRILLSAKS